MTPSYPQDFIAVSQIKNSLFVLMEKVMLSYSYPSVFTNTICNPLSIPPACKSRICLLYLFYIFQINSQRPKILRFKKYQHVNVCTWRTLEGKEAQQSSVVSAPGPRQGAKLNSRQKFAACLTRCRSVAAVVSIAEIGRSCFRHGSVRQFMSLGVAWLAWRPLCYSDIHWGTRVLGTQLELECGVRTEEMEQWVNNGDRSDTAQGVCWILADLFASHLYWDDG